MSVSKAELAEILARSIDEEFAFAVKEAEKEPHEFSEEHEAKMAELIKTGKPNDKKGLSKRGRRILIIAIAAVLALTASACAVPEIRESIAGFFVKVFGDHVEYSDPAITKETIEEKYGLIPLPNGFTITDSNEVEGCVSTTYSDDDQNTILLIQAAKGKETSFVDNENGSAVERDIGNKSVRLYYSGYSAQASWIQDGYYFYLSYSSPIGIDDFEAWIESVQPN
jgi:hypothetical protein